MNAFECRSGSWFFSIVLLMSVFSFPAVRAATPGVAFSPTVIDFGTIPSGEQPTQLLAVTLDRTLFSLDHLPSLQNQDSNGPVIALFSRSVTQTVVTQIYRVKMLDNGEYGPFRYRLVLSRANTTSTVKTPSRSIADSGVLVQGEILQGLEGGPTHIDFGAVRYGKGASKGFRIGFFHSNIMLENQPTLPSSDMSKLLPIHRPMTGSLDRITVSSTSRYITALKGQALGINASISMDWQIVLSPDAPQEDLESELVFQTGDGYFFIVPVTADLSGPGYPIPRWKPSKQRKHSK